MWKLTLLDRLLGQDDHLAALPVVGAGGEGADLAPERRAVGEDQIEIERIIARRTSRATPSALLHAEATIGSGRVWFNWDALRHPAAGLLVGPVVADKRISLAAKSLIRRRPGTGP